MKLLWILTMKISQLLNEEESPGRVKEIKPPQPPKGSKNSEYTKPSEEYAVRTAELEKAAMMVKNGEMSSREYWKLVGQHKPVSSYTDIPEPATMSDMVAGLRGNGQYEKIDADIPDGELVHLRLDINAYKNYGVWAPTIHTTKSGGGIGQSISHMPVAIVNNVTFTVESAKNTTNKQSPLKIATGEAQKFPVATVTGNYEWAAPEDAKKQAQAALSDPNWIQVGMDPRRHSYFYDRKNRRPVISGSRAIQIGGLILLKGPIVYGKRSDYMYESPSAALYKQLDEEIMDELSYFGRPCTDKCQGHRAGDQWQKRQFDKVVEEPITDPLINRKVAAANSRIRDPRHPSFNNGTDIAIDQLKKGINTISGGVKDASGRFTKYTGPERYKENYATNDHLGFGERPADIPVIEQQKNKKRKK